MVKDLNMEDENEQIPNVPSLMLVNQSFNHESAMSSNQLVRREQNLKVI